MRLAYPNRSDEQQASLVRGILFHEPPRQKFCFGDTRLFFVVLVILEGVELAVLVARWNLRRRHQPLAAAFRTALAAHHLALFAARNVAPSSATAGGARCLGLATHIIHSWLARSSTLLPAQPRRKSCAAWHKQGCSARSNALRVTRR